jgi:membrane fusion protein, multidrug efflux system
MSPLLSRLGLAVVLILANGSLVMAQPAREATKRVKPSGPAAKKADELIRSHTAWIEKDIEQSRKEVERLRAELHELIDVRCEMATAIAELRGELAASGTYSADVAIAGQEATPDKKASPPSQGIMQGVKFRQDLLYGLGSALPKDPTPEQREQLRRLAPQRDLKRLIERLRAEVEETRTDVDQMAYKLLELREGVPTSSLGGMGGMVIPWFGSMGMHNHGEAQHEHHKIVVTSPMATDIVITQEYVCKIHSQRHINVRTLENGYLEAIPVNEGQAVKTGDVLFEIVPVLYKAKLGAEMAEVQLAQLEFNNTKKLFEQKAAVSENEVRLFQAKLDRAKRKAALARAELDFATVKAPFDGIIGRLHEQQGSLVKEGDILTTLSDNSMMWVYFNVSEARYLKYMAELGQGKDSPEIELRLANGDKFPETGRLNAVEAQFNNENGNIAFRADFPNPANPHRLLRHGQTGSVLIHRALKNAIVIPQRATFETLAKRYVFVVGKDDVVHQREIVVQNEKDDAFVIKRGVDVGDKIVLEGIPRVREGEKVEYEFRHPDQVIANLKNKAE